MNIFSFFLVFFSLWENQSENKGLKNDFKHRFDKHIYDDVTEDIFDMSNVSIFKEIEKKKMGDVYTLLCLRSAELSKTFGLRDLCYFKISVVMLLGYRSAGISRKLESER